MRKSRSAVLSVEVNETQVDAIVIQNLMQAVDDALLTAQCAEDFTVILSLLVVLEYYCDPDTWDVYSRINMPSVRDAMAEFGVEMR